MKFFDLNDNKIYQFILERILKECDEVSFHFPILDEKSYSTDELAEDYKKYTQSKQVFLNELFNHGAKQKISRTYQNIKLGYETQIIYVKLYPELIQKIKNHHLFEWVWWNALPEDLCFFSQKRCRFVTVSHEELFYENNG